MSRGLRRNDPCWCASGKKYKKCHMGKDGFGRKNPLILSPIERDGMRSAGRFNAELMDFIRPHIKPGISTESIDKLVHDYTVDHHHIPACLGYRRFPKSCCISVNEMVCHGIPDRRVLKEGDIVNVDLTTIVDGWHGDQSETFLIGEVSEKARALAQCSLDCLYLGIRAIKPRAKVSDIGRAIKPYAKAHGFSVVRDYQGHGIGRKFHQEPGVPHYPALSLRPATIYAGMCFTIEPMINGGTWRVREDPVDRWTVRTLDGELSAQFEHTILMTETGPEILTLTEKGPQEGHRF